MTLPCKLMRCGSDCHRSIQVTLRSMACSHLVQAPCCFRPAALLAPPSSTTVLTSSCICLHFSFPLHSLCRGGVGNIPQACSSSWWILRPRLFLQIFSHFATGWYPWVRQIEVLILPHSRAPLGVFFHKKKKSNLGMFSISIHFFFHVVWKSQNNQSSCLGAWK